MVLLFLAKTRLGAAHLFVFFPGSQIFVQLQKMKKFFDDFKKDIKFKSAGPGKKLTEDTRQITNFSFLSCYSAKQS